MMARDVLFSATSSGRRIAVQCKLRPGPAASGQVADGCGATEPAACKRFLMPVVGGRLRGHDGVERARLRAAVIVTGMNLSAAGAGAE